ncbi:DUF3224 domain-containing protein [Janthinobacterium fluminis]|uniref:DUF3224 domain-containing protein n=1 Tax=Janthinobacterium fluminis TaxID=2987524 RepID=A0ABT5JTM2_9BURK|nr:DUF3224 domain-containing protein [Janthinobacterium fluminis]MDC8756092.1 DUF3224 domain-containing protein [Janthinobacterium fluminis]
MPFDFPLTLSTNFVAASWAETPFHEMADAGKLSRATIVNTLSGGIEGEGTLEYLLAYPAVPGADVAFVGYERIVSAAAGREGSFTMKHEGCFSPLFGVSGALNIVAGSGTGVFAGLGGSGVIKAKAGEHGGEYCLTLDKAP